jgi:acyl-CoA reductase-like NAD-dependent aldehyde dehydrogenase
MPITKTVQSFNARTGNPIGDSLAVHSTEQVEHAVKAAADAFKMWSSSSGQSRKALLDALATALENHREELVKQGDEETALGAARLNGELDRTAFQLRRFGTLALNGAAFDKLVDPAVAGAPPVGHPTLVRLRVPLGPVAMFSASNFPFAFSVLGGDTASALAAGCSVVVKAHTAHLRLSLQVHALAQKVLSDLQLPSGLIGLVYGGGSDVGVQLIEHPSIAAGAFTGSTRGGAALAARAAARSQPIPFYGELGSVNPVIVLPDALAAQTTEPAQMLAASICQGCGQFCTSPGVIVVPRGPEGDAFVSQLAASLSTLQPHEMLTPAMREAFDAGVQHWLAAGVAPILHEPSQARAPRPFLGQAALTDFVANEAYREEVFGPAAIVIRVDNIADAAQALAAVGGSLTVTLWGAQKDSPEVRKMIKSAMAIAGRVLFAGVPTGVAVTAGQQHGGPWPSSTQPMTTSVGDAALDRFLRPVALQDAPEWLLNLETV